MGRFNLEQIKGKLIVSCQALPEEPLHSSYIMGRMAYAAMLGGASGIRCNTVEDIAAIKCTVNLPLIGIIKEVYDDSDVFITPTMKEIEALVNAGCEIIASDATHRPRPQGQSLADFFAEVRARYPEQLFMADCSTYEEGMRAAELGFDLIGTTLCGYTPYTKGTALPNVDLLARLARDCSLPIIAEGGIWSPEDLARAMAAGSYSAVVGSAITRPMLITQRYAAVLERGSLTGSHSC